MKDKKEKKSGDQPKTSKINDGLCCRCVNRTCEKKCKITDKYTPRKHKCDVTVKGKSAFKYKD